MIACLRLAAQTHTASIGIVWRARWNGKHTDAGSGDLVLGGGRRDLGGCNCAGEDEDGDEGANDVFHSEVPPKLYLLKKISLDKPDEVTIGYRME